jgi:hypothetical protein
MVTAPQHFIFGSETDFASGLAVNGGLKRSMEQEFAENDGGAWVGEYLYVVKHAAIPVPDVASDDPARQAAATELEAIHPSLEAKRGRDVGNAGKRLHDFWQTARELMQAHPSDSVRSSNVTHAEVATLRLYTGPSYKPMNAALRAREIDEWATTLSLCSSGLMKLSYLSKPMRVYRGVKEDKAVLPFSFLNADDGAFAGGVELAFMSTTPLPKSPRWRSFTWARRRAPFLIDFDFASRGASVQFLSQFPHEEELVRTHFSALPPAAADCCRQLTGSLLRARCVRRASSSRR